MARKESYQAELIYDEEYLIRAAEAALFAYGSAISFDKLAEAIGTEERVIPKLLDAMIGRYENNAIELLILDGHAQLATKSQYAEVVRNALTIRHNQPLSRAALEVLAIIAYNQPATRALVDRVRGVESPSVIMSLCDKGLIEEKGRLDAPGRPMLYGTTTVFLRTFGLETIDDLDEVPELHMFTQQIKEQRRQLLLGEEMTESQKNQLTLEENTTEDTAKSAENETMPLIPAVADPTVTDTGETPFEVRIEEQDENAENNGADGE